MSKTGLQVDRSAAVIGLLTVIAANWIYMAGLSLILDLTMSMEAFYIDMAQHSVASILAQDPGWGPLYALWLKPFRMALSDPVAVYRANLYAVSLGASTLIYLYVLVLSNRAAVAAGAAIFFLISDLNVPLASKATGFALMVLLAGLTVSELVPGGARRLSIAATGVLAASYARPELYPAALCLCLAAIWLARREPRNSSWRILLWPATSVALIVITAVWIGTPVFSPDHRSDRLFVAFREHFAWNWSRWHDQRGYYQSIWEQEFGGAHTTLQAFVNNPNAVAHHLLDNLRGSVSFLVGSTFDHYPLLAPATVPELVKAENLSAAAAALGALILVAVRPTFRRQFSRRYGHLILPYVTVAAFSLMSATAIFPIAHYLALPGVLLLLVGALALAVVVPAPSISPVPYRALAALVCLAAVPRPFVLPSAYVVSGSPRFKGRITVARPVADTIAFIRSLQLSPPVQVLTMTDGIGELLGPGFREVKVWQKGEQPLESYIRDQRIDLIVTMEPGQDSFFVDDPYWKIIQNDPGTVGFTLLSVPSQPARIFARADLMRKKPDGSPSARSHPEDSDRPRH